MQKLHQISIHNFKALCNKKKKQTEKPTAIIFKGKNKILKFCTTQHSDLLHKISIFSFAQGAIRFLQKSYSDD